MKNGGPAPVPKLIAVAHGSRNIRATATVRDLVNAVQLRRPESTATACFLDHGSPTLAETVAKLDRPAVVVPLLLTAAYHSGVDIPAQLEGATQPVVQSEVLGPDPLLLAALERRLREVGVLSGDPEVAVVLGAAGSSDPSAIETLRALAREWVRAGWWAVEPAFASAAAPTVKEAVAELRARGAPRVAVASYLLSPGLFADHLRQAGADLVSGPLGAAPEIATLILERYDAAVLGSQTPVESRPRHRRPAGHES